jgi:glycosyltransferase involved in cell wall biosynthesis
MNMKVVVQIPCLNEEQTLPLVLESMPKKIAGVDSLEILVIDDGSTDKTRAIAEQYGVKHFVVHPHRKGLARSFHDGILKALDMGADIIVNTDGDNQYPQERIADLVQPIIDNKADIVIADRQVKKIKHFSPGKKLMQKVGTRVLNLAAGTDVPDAPSGFRAYSRDAAIQLNVVTRFSYAMETIIQAGNKNLSIVSIPVKTNPKTRESRLFNSSWEHIRKSGIAITRAFIMYRPYVFFLTLGLLLLVAGLVPVGRFLYFFIFENSERSGHVQSLVLGSVLLVGAFISFAMGIIADLIRINRTLTEDLLEQVKHARFDKNK